MARLSPLPESTRRGVNEELLAFLRARAQPGTRSPWDVDDFELHAHPDLIERLAEAAEWTDAEMVAAYGSPLLVHPNGVVLAVAIGQRALFFRLPGELRVGMVDLGVGDLIGPEWIAAAAWPPDLTAPEGKRRVKQWCRRACENAGSLALEGDPPASEAR